MLLAERWLLGAEDQTLLALQRRVNQGFRRNPRSGQDDAHSACANGERPTAFLT